MKTKTYITAVACLLVAVSGTTYAGGNAADGKTKSSKCATCHGADGKGSGSTPAIAGMDAAKFTAAVNDYKSGKRKNAMMEMMAKKLSDQDIADLAAHYSTLK
jgi:cytochrome c553